MVVWYLTSWRCTEYRLASSKAKCVSVLSQSLSLASSSHLSFSLGPWKKHPCQLRSVSLRTLRSEHLHPLFPLFSHGLWHHFGCFLWGWWQQQQQFLSPSPKTPQGTRAAASCCRVRWWSRGCPGFTAGLLFRMCRACWINHVLHWSIVALLLKTSLISPPAWLHLWQEHCRQQQQ